MSRTATPADVLSGAARWCVVEGDARTGSPLAEHTLAARKAAAGVAQGIDRLFEDLTEDRL